MDDESGYGQMQMDQPPAAPMQGAQVDPRRAMLARLLAQGQGGTVGMPMQGQADGMPTAMPMPGGMPQRGGFGFGNRAGGTPPPPYPMR